MTKLVIHRADDRSDDRLRPLPIVGTVILTALALHLIVTRPMMNRVEALSVEIASARSELAAVAGSKTDAWRTNDLLTALTIQAERVAAAEGALRRINAMAATVDTLDQRVAEVALKTDDAFETVERFNTLHDRLASAAGTSESVRRDLDDIASVADRIDELATVAPMHEQSLNDLHLRVGALSHLVNDIVVHEPAIKRAEKRIDAVVDMSNRLTQVDTEAAAATADGLIAVADTLQTAGAAMVEPAETVLAKLQTATAGLAGQSGRLQMLIESAEVIQDFESELAAHIRGLEGIRRQMIEFAMLESTVGRVAGMLQPLSEIASLHQARPEDLKVVLDDMRAKDTTLIEMVAEADPSPAGVVTRPSEGPNYESEQVAGSGPVRTADDHEAPVRTVERLVPEPTGLLR